MLLFLLSCLISGEPDNPNSYAVNWVEAGYRNQSTKIVESSVKSLFLAVMKR